MGQTRKLYVDGEYGQIHLRFAADEGTGDIPPLFCLHQSPKCSAEFERFMQAARGDRAIVAADYPGYGMSSQPPSEDDATIEMYARNMWQVADMMGLDQVDLFGNHTGGKVATEMALQQPERVRGIVMVSAAILTDEERNAFRDFFTPVPLDEAGTRYTTMWQRIVNGRGPGVSLEMLAESFTMNLMGGEAYEWGHKAAFDYGEPFERALKELPHRITILNPVDDLTEMTRRAAPLMRNGEIVECPDWGYNFLDAFSAEAAKLVLGKLDAN